VKRLQREAIRRVRQECQAIPRPPKENARSDQVFEG